MPSDSGMREYQDERAAQQDSEEVSSVEHDAGPVIAPPVAAAMLGGPMSKVQRQALVQNVGQHYGNKQVQRMLGAIQRSSELQRDDDTRSASATYEGGALESNIADRIQSERSNGRPLDGSIKESAQRSLGYDLSLARVHDGPAAAQLSHDVGAIAFTTGRDIFVGDKGSASDTSLMTHELTHTVQQGMSETPPSSIGAADTAHEHAAESNAAGASSGGVQRHADEVQELRDPSLQREEEIEEMRDPRLQREEEIEELRDPALQREEDEVQELRDPTLQREADDEVQELRDPTLQREEDEVQELRDPTLQREEEIEEMRDPSLQREEEIEELRDPSLQRENEEEIAEMRDPAIQREETEEEAA